jgi:hypothetical protein
MMNGMPIDLGWCNVHVQEYTFRLAAENAGTLSPVSKPGPAGGRWSARRGDYDFAVDQQALRTGVLRVGYAFNALMAETLRGETVDSPPN